MSKSTNARRNPFYVCISRQNSKLGNQIPCVNLPPKDTCRPDAPCTKLCYGNHGRFIFPNVKKTMQNNLHVWKENPEAYELAVVTGAFPYRFFRWHSAGDIPDMNYLEMMIRVANTCKETKFLCFTKKYELVNEYLDNHNGELPENLNIVFSAWGCFPFANPYNLPVAYVRLKNCECHIPEDAHECCGFCGECVINNACCCWNLKRGQSVVFNLH